MRIAAHIRSSFLSNARRVAIRRSLTALGVFAAVGLIAVACSDQQLPTEARQLTIRHNVSPGEGPTVSTDKYDYLPGETLTIGGAGWAAGETVHLQVVHVDDAADNESESHQQWDVISDSSGNISSVWIVPEADAGATLKLSADGEVSGAHAEVIFDDLTGSAAARLFTDAARTTSQSAFPWGATIYPRLEGGSVGICYRIRWFNPSDVVQQTTIIGKGSTSYNPASYTVPATGPSGTWYALVDENNGALDCNTATYSNATDRINFDVARAVVIGAGTTGSDATGGDNCVHQVNPPPTTCTATAATTYVRTKPSDNARTYLRFDLSAASPGALPAGASITLAQVRLTVATTPVAQRTYNIQRADATWNEGAITWANQPGVTGAVGTGTILTTLTGGLGGGDPQTWVKWSVTADVQGFASGSFANNGWRISDATENNASEVRGRFHTTEGSCTGGTCKRVMPVLLIDYTTVTPDNTSVGTIIHYKDPATDIDSAGVTSVPLGSTVHDKATVTNTGGGTGNGTPEGTVSFTFWTDGTCGTGGGTSSSAGASVALSSGVAHPSDSKGPLAAGAYSFKASYTSSDATRWSNSVGSCEPLTVTKATPVLTTAIHRADETVIVDSSYVYEGTVVHDSGVLTGSVGAFDFLGGTITYSFYRNYSCTGTAAATTAALALPGGLESGAFPSTGQPLPPGQYSYKATYSGNTNYNGDTSDCEPFTVVPHSSITGGGLCTFDRRTDVAGQQFNAIFTPEAAATTSKLNATNPGQFRFNVFYIPNNGTASISIQIPAGFVTQGATPVHVYGAVSPATDNNGVTCFTPSSERSAQHLTVTGAAGGTLNVDITGLGSPSPRVIYIVVHLDYYWKNVLGGCTKQPTGTNPILEHANCTAPSAITLNSLTNYTFGALGNALWNKTIQNFNVFKKDPGIGGLVLKQGTGDPVPNVTVDIYQGNKKVGSVLTDEDGWYMWVYKYTGKATTFTVKLPAYNLSQDFTLKSNGYGIINFNVP